MHEKHGLSWTLKVHVILDHFPFYFKKTGTTLRHTNGEFPEATHSTLRKSEEKHGFKIVRSIGSPIHQQSSLKSHTLFNSTRIGSVSPVVLRAKSKSPFSSPSPNSRSPFSSSFLEKYSDDVAEHYNKFK